MSQGPMTELLELYRQGIREYVAELDELRPAMVSRDERAVREARRIAHSVHGSGGTYGLPHLSACAELAENAPSTALVRRMDGFVRILRREGYPTDLRAWHTWEWLPRAAASGEGEPSRHAAEGLSNPGAGHGQLREGAASIVDAWAEARVRFQLDDATLLRRIADLYGVEVARAEDVAAVADPELLLAVDGTFVPRVLPGAGPAPRVLVVDPTDLEDELVVERLLGESPVLVVTTPGAPGDAKATP